MTSTSDTLPREPAPAQVKFSEREYLALFPSFPALPPTLSGKPVLEDPAAELRRMNPVTPDSILHALAPWPAIRVGAKLSLFLGNLGNYSDAVFLATFLAMIPLCVGTISWNTGTFERTSLVAGSVVLCLLLLNNAAYFYVAKNISRKFLTIGRIVDESQALNALPVSALVRWLELINKEDNSRESALALEQEKLGDDDPPAVLVAVNEPTNGSLHDLTPLANNDGGPNFLLRHDPLRPDLCPCPLSTCAGRLPVRTAWNSLLRGFLVSGAVVVFFVGCYWTPLVRFAASNWTTWWTALAGVVVVLAGIVEYLIVFFFGLQMVTPALLDVSFRMHQRAVTLSLSSFLKKVNHSLETGIVLPVGADALHLSLHQVLAQTWLNRLDAGRTLSHLMLGFLLSSCFVATVATTASGSCVPMYIFGQLGVVLVHVGGELISFALSNSQVDAIGLLYDQARDELRISLAHASTSDRNVRQDLRYHELVLSSLAEVERYKARFLGFAVTFGLLRTLVATLFTLGIGLYSIMRGFGTFVTPETFCQIR